MKQKHVLAACALFAAANSGCSAAPGVAARADGNRQNTHAMETKMTGQGVPITQQFHNLDEYLAFLERQSHMDGKWYKPIKPGLYELQAGNLHLDTPSGDKRFYTREELEKKFGFSK